MDGANVDYVSKYKETQNTLKNKYSDFQVPFNGKDNDDYINGGGFCCDDSPKLRAGAIGNGNDNPEIFQYYYHSDHLGSTSLITDLDGNVVQHVEYVPFGEVFIEERNNKWNTPYLFNAKELDEETGLYYYGARYYDGRTATWLGVDPMWEKYPGVSAFAYCTNNPVKYIDPDGRKIKLADNYTGAMTNIAQIAATNLGNEALNHIINCKETYTLNSTFLTSNSTYNAITRTIFYVGNPWSSDIEGGFLNSMTAMGHEIFHAFDHSYNVFNTRNAGYSINIAEPRAVSFANYLRQAYSLYPLREKHGTTKGNFHQFQNLDKVSNFTLLGNNADNTSFGFSYTKTTTTVIDYIEVVGYRIPNKKIVNSQVHYIIVSTDKDKNVTYQIYNNENEYKNASQGWQ